MLVIAGEQEKMKGYFNGASYADLNNDGKLDLIINCINSPAVILKNNSPAKNFLSLSFHGSPMNKFGIGTKAYLWTHFKNIAGHDSSVVQYMQLMLTRGFQSSSDTKLHFWLRYIKNIDSLLIVWPDQKYQLIKNVSINKNMIINYQNAADSFSYTVFFPPKKKLLTDITSQIHCTWKHKENSFNDFNFQYLIPHTESTRGPKIAVADINKDGLDDFFVCGAKGQPGALMVQQQNGSFVSTDTALFAQDAMQEEVDAIFFDANNDGFTDLFVVSGGNEPQGDSPVLLIDRLYINNGKGHFSKNLNSLCNSYTINPAWRLQILTTMATLICL